MRKCVNCGIDVGGGLKACPLCQNPLIGEAGPDIWPKASKLKLQAFAYKLQLFIMLATAAVSLGLDFLLEIRIPGMKHYGIVFAAWIIAGELVVRSFIRKSFVMAKVITMSAFYIVLMMVLTSWYYYFLHPMLYLVLPIVLSVTLITNFVFSLIDKTENAMVYLLANILCGIIPYVILLAWHKTRSLAWSICLMISAVTFIGIVVFKGRKVWLEVQKRMNI